MLLPSPFILGSTIQERQIASKSETLVLVLLPDRHSLALPAAGIFQETSTGNTGNGTSINTLNYVDLAGNTFSRQVNADLNKITLDHQSGSLASAPSSLRVQAPSGQEMTMAKARLPGGRSIG